MMAFTPTLVLPLPSTPDVIYPNLWGECNTTTQPSDTAAFEMGINERDNEACLVCESTDFEGLDRCHIIPSFEGYTLSSINIPTCHLGVRT